jgi:hypothetical protein
MEDTIMAEKVDSHASWYKGKWEADVCACGNVMKVPIGTKGQYRCNTCASPSPEDGPCSENNDNLGESPDY